ncbi:MAG: hypothetical protein A2Z95_10255 [Gallionellales bacterium GWA2_60_18]|nr:MAG: hypothetical protein A2Z95_10255 [Gallionellales bacterium GWA2_60_18]
MNLKETQLPGITQIELIRKIQTDIDRLAFYATAVSGECERDGCGWCEDCFDDVREQTGCQS